MAADPGKETLPAREERKDGALQTMCKRKAKAQNHRPNPNPNAPGGDLPESGGSSSSGTWMASDACEGCSSGSGSGSSGSGSNGGPVDCDPGSLRLRSLLQAADHGRSGSLTSSGSDGESESEEKESREEAEGWGAEGPPRFVTRAASARRFMDRARASSADSAIAAVASAGGGGGGKADAVAAGQDADVEGAAALAAALEAVLLCPPQVLARSASCQGQGSFLSSLLTPTSEPSDRGDDHPCPGAGAAGGDGVGDKEDDDSAEDAVKAALAWSFPVPKLPSVEEECGATTDEGETAISTGEGQDRRTVSERWDIVASSVPGSRSNGMPESAVAAAAAEGCCASDSAVVLAGRREGFGVVDGDHGVAGVCGRENGEESRGCPTLAVSSDGSGGGGGGGGKARRRASLTSESSGEPDTDTLPPSPAVTGQLSARTPLNACAPAEAPSAAASSEAAAASRSSHVTVTPTGAGGGFVPCGMSLERSPTRDEVGSTTGNAYSKTAADDDDSGSVEDDGDNGSKFRRSSFTSTASSAPSDHRGHQRPRWGSLSRGEFSPEDGPPSATAQALEREKLLLSVFGQQAGVAELATVGRSNSCHIFLEAASRIAALPPLERSLLAGLDRTSDDEGGNGDGDGDGDSTSHCAGNGNGHVASPPPAKENAPPSSEGTAVAAVSPGTDRELPLLRVGCAEAGAGAGRDAAPTTAYRYRRLAGNSGRGWPPRVDPARREEWLCPIEFKAVFGMSFVEFRELPSWKRTLLKQEVHLF